jgi:hypothetical protein
MEICLHPRLPNSSQRTAVIGRTGSGKTVASVWHLSKQNVDVMPWVAYNFKGDALIDSIPNAEFIELDYVPKKAGIYIAHPMPSQEEKLTAHIWKLWERRGVGIFADEGYMMGANNEAFQACLTQGRSLRIPMIVCSQRPAWISRFVFSEADFYQLFHLNDERDKETVLSFLPVGADEQLPEYHSYYYEVGRNKLWKMGPVPEPKEILAALDAKLEKKRPKSL